MMDNEREASTPGSLFGSYPSFGGGSIGGTGSLSGLSPYLNVDPSYLQTQAPEFIRNEASINTVRVERSLLIFKFPL